MIVGYRFTPYSKTRGFSRKHGDIYEPDVLKATNKFLQNVYHINMSVIHLHIHTIDRPVAVSGRKALDCFGDALECTFASKKIRFKIEKLVRKTKGDDDD
jgi:hypothetical protein